MKTIPRVAIPVPTLADHAYNRRCWPAFAEAVRQAGGAAVEVALTLDDAALREVAASCEAVLLPGSPADVDPMRYGHARKPECAAADPARERTDLWLLDEAQAKRKPLLAVCFGMQMMNVWRGGTLVQDLSIVPVNHVAARGVAVAHTVAVPPESKLGGLVEAEEARMEESFLRLPINSSHHQAVGRPGAGLRVVARCPQDGVIEAVEGDGSGSWVMGVQWHPERTYAQSATSRALFARLIAECSREE